MDILFTSSHDIPYTDTNYKGTIVIPMVMNDEGKVFPTSNNSYIPCLKVSEKKFEDRTYYKVDLPQGIVISSDQEINLELMRDDDYKMVIKATIKDNKIVTETANKHWVKVEPIDSISKLPKIIGTLENFPVDWSHQQTIGNSPIRYVSYPVTINGTTATGVSTGTTLSNVTINNLNNNAVEMTTTLTSTGENFTGWLDTIDKENKEN